MADAIVPFAAEGILKMVGNQIASMLGGELRLARGFKKELEELKNTLELIPLPGQQINAANDSAARKWLQRITDAAYDAQNVLEDIANERIRREQQFQPEAEISICRSFLELLSKVRCFFSEAMFNLTVAHKIRDMNQTLEKIKSDGAGLGLAMRARSPDGNTSAGIPRIRLSDSFLRSSELVVGRKGEVAKVIKFLVDARNNSQRLSVVSVVGMAGLGKTTLAKKVLKEAQGKELFDKTIWVCVSNTFDDLEILRGMVESVDKNATIERQKDPMLQCLRRALKDKSFLLVLDDVWNEEKSRWNHLKEDLSIVNEGNKNCVLVTTRNEKVGDIMESTPQGGYNLRGLTNDECWAIIKDGAFVNELISSELEEIGKQIAKKCGGLPLVAKVLGPMMRDKKTKEEWLSIQRSKALDEVTKSGEIQPILQLSFDRLPTASLKQCFVYCAIFPKDFVFRKEELVQQWISLRFFQDENGKSMEDIGNEHFNFLSASSLFQDIEEDSDFGITECKMHDVVHDLAQHIAKFEIWMYERENIGDPSSVRLLNISEKEEMLNRVANNGSLEKLHVLFSKIDVFKNVIWNFTSLRTLNLSGYTVEELPAAMGKAKHLTYIDVSWTKIKSFPESITKLCNMQTLICKCCMSLEQLPEGIHLLFNLRYLDVSKTGINTLPRCITNLYNLQTLICLACQRLEQLPEDIHLLFNLSYLDVSETSINMLPKSITRLSKLETLRFLRCRHLKEFPEGAENLVSLKHIYFDDPQLTPAQIGQLTSLETLSLFGVGEEEGRGIEELGGLGKLKGKLVIKGLENVRNKEKAMGANLKGKLGLRKIEIVWDTESDDEANNDGEVLKALQPPPSIQTLRIKGFRGEKFPDWISDPNALPQLVELELFYLQKCVELPALSRLPNLEIVKIQGAPNVRRINWDQSGANGIVFPSLKKLSLASMMCLEEWESAASEDEIRFPRLTKLFIWFCGKLSCLSGVRGVKSLLSLDLMGCGVTCFPTWLQQCKSLKSLDIVQCHDLTSVPDWLKDFTSLTNLSILHCPNLRYFPGENLSHLTSLRRLRIGGFSEELQELPFYAPITSLSIIGWKGLKSKSLLDQIKKLTSLEVLKINDFCEMEALPEWLGNLSSLHSLYIYSCPTLKYLPSEDAMRHLKYLSISDCPELEERCKQDAAEWPKISQIPRVEIKIFQIPAAETLGVRIVSKAYEYGKLVRPRREG